MTFSQDSTININTKEYIQSLTSKAHIAYSNTQYQKSITYYKELVLYLSYIKQTKEITKKLKETRKKVLIVYKSFLNEEFKEKKTELNQIENAITIAKQAAEFFPNNLTIKNYIPIFEKQKKQILRNLDSIHQQSSINQKNKDEIKFLLKKAKLFYAQKRYFEARNTIRIIYSLNPTNSSAIALENLILKKYNKFAQRRFDDLAINKVPFVRKRKIFTHEKSIRNKIKRTSTILDKKIYIKFNNDSLEEAIKKLSLKENLNITTKLNKKILTKIFFNFQDKSIEDILNAISFITDTTYRTNNDRVIFYDKEQFFDELITKKFTYSEEIFEILDKKSNFDSEFRKFLKQFGLKNTEGSIYKYNPTTRVIEIKDSKKNIEIISSLLANLNKETNQVSIKTQFIEITENLLKDISFLWDLNLDNANKINNVSNVNLVNSTAIPSVNNRNITQSISSGDFINPNNPDINARTRDVQTSTARFDLSKLINFGKLSGAKLQLLTRLVNQNQNTKIIFSPKVVTSSGEEAEIKIVEERFLPQSWSRPNPNVTSTRGQIALPNPLLGTEPEELGIVFRITPTISDDIQSINMEIGLFLRELLGFQDYTPDAQNAANVFRIESDQVVSSQAIGLTIVMPIISNRSLETILSLKDGDTTTIGSLTNEIETGRKNTNPILSKIPLIGRFFKSDASSRVSTNLIINLSAEIVDSSGLPIKSKNYNIPTY